MPPSLEIIVVLMTMSLAVIFGQPPKKGIKGTRQTGQVLPAILSGDQSLPAIGAFPIDAIPTDLMAGRINQMRNQVVPVVSSNNFAGGKVRMNSNIASVNSMSGQAEYPVVRKPVNNVAVLRQSNNIQNVNQSPEVKRLPNSAMNGMNYPPGPAPVNPPMNMYQQWASPMSASMVIRNIQIACSTLQNFILGTPLAREITASVSNMNNIAEIFNSPKQCGFPALSTTLQVFLKTCNIYSACSNPTRGPAPVPAQPISQEVPYKVQQQTMSTLNPQVVVPQPRPVNRPPLTPPAFLRQQYQAFQTQLMMMFNWLNNNFQPSHQINTAKGQQKKTNNTTTAPFDD